MVEIIPGRILRADIVFGNTHFSFINVYAPNVGQERISFFKTLSDALLQCPQGNIVYYMKSSFPKRYKSILIVFMKMTFFYLDP